jgi:hypothetical protein
LRPRVSRLASAPPRRRGPRAASILYSSMLTARLRSQVGFGAAKLLRVRWNALCRISARRTGAPLPYVVEFLAHARDQTNPPPRQRRRDEGFTGSLAWSLVFAAEDLESAGHLSARPKWTHCDVEVSRCSDGQAPNRQLVCLRIRVQTTIDRTKRIAAGVHVTIFDDRRNSDSSDRSFSRSRGVLTTAAHRS